MSHSEYLRVCAGLERLPEQISLADHPRPPNNITSMTQLSWPALSTFEKIAHLFLKPCALPGTRRREDNVRGGIESSVDPEG